MRVVVDTNVLLASISRKSSSHCLFHCISEKKFEIAYTTDILIEYEEQISEHWTKEVAIATIQSLIELSNAIPTTLFYKLDLIEADKDDNKFVDCAFASNSTYIVTEDKHFNVLKKINFPLIKVVNIAEFKEILKENNLL